MYDALMQRLEKLYETPEVDVQEYIKEAFYRESAGYSQVSPRTWFNAPANAPVPYEAEKVYETLSGQESPAPDWNTGGEA